MILGTDFTAMNIVGVIWTHKGTQKLMHSNRKTIMELQDTTASIPLAMAYSMKIEPGGHRTVPLECSSQLADQMDIRVSAGFHHRNPNVYIPPSCINNPGNEFHPQFIPLTIFNLSKVDHLYIGRDTVVAFADKPAVDVYHVEIASDEKIKEHLAKPRNWVPQHHETLPEICSNTTFICSPADVPGHCKVHLQDKEISADIHQSCVKSIVKHSHNEDIGRTKPVKMDINTGDSPRISSRPYTLPLKHYEWVQREIESLEQAGVIKKSMSNWASPTVIVPKKSASRKPLKRRLCIDFRKVNELQQEVQAEGNKRG